MVAYMLADIDVKDAKTFEQYREKVGPIVAKFGGRYVVRGGETRVLEGSHKWHRLVLLEFPNIDAAQRFYDSGDYKPVLKLRLDSTNSEVVILDGYNG